MTQTEQQRAAKRFSQDWQGKGYEKGESQKFWLDLLCNVYGVQDFANFVYFENQIKEQFTDKTITNFIDIYIPSTKVMIEQKSQDKDLRSPIKQSDGSLLNPFQQARKYIAGLLTEAEMLTVNPDVDENTIVNVADLAQLKKMIAGLIKQTEDTFKAVCTGAYIHGMTADNIVKQYGPLAATPTRIIENINQ